MDDHAQSRREFLRGAATVAWATPLILTLAPHRAYAQSASCAPAGTGCGTWSTPLDGCLPSNPPVLCCNGCERAAPPNEMYCVCT